MIRTVTKARRRNGRAFVLAALLVGVATAARESGAQSLRAAGSPPALVVSTAIAGLNPAPTIDNSTTYTIQGVKSGTGTLTAQLDAPMPPGVTLTITLGASHGATSLGPITLGTAPQTVVTGITSPANQTNPVTYQFSATAAAGVVPMQTRTVMLTLVVLP